MADIKIDLKRITDANSGMPGMISQVEGARRSVGLMRWRIPEEIQTTCDIKKRLDSVVADMQRAEKLLEDIKRVVGSGITFYSESDARAKNAAEKFL